MAFLDDGAAYAVWHWPQPPTSRGVMYNYCSEEGAAWDGQAWLSSDTLQSGANGDACAVVAADEYANAVRVAWGRDSLGVSREIWWRSNYLGGGGGMGRPVALAQTGIELFPNPAKAGFVTVQYSLPRAEPVAVTLLDVSGRAVRTQGISAAGANGSFTVDASGLNPGVYILKLESGTSSLTRKLVIH
jgi:hypothetical protein